MKANSYKVYIYLKDDKSKHDAEKCIESVVKAPTMEEAMEEALKPYRSTEQDKETTKEEVK